MNCSPVSWSTRLLQVRVFILSPIPARPTASRDFTARPESRKSMAEKHLDCCFRKPLVLNLFTCRHFPPLLELQMPRNISMRVQPHAEKVNGGKYL